MQISVPTFAAGDTATPYQPLPATATPVPVFTATATACRAPAGEVVDSRFDSTVLGEGIPAKVYLPPCFDRLREEGYPLLVMLHGQNGKEEQWVSLGIKESADELINSGGVPAMVIVMPREEKHLVDSDQSMYAEALVEDVLPQSVASFNIRPERFYRAIGGLSRGANWAVRVGFTHPEAFGAVGAHSYTTFSGDLGRIRVWMQEAAVNDLPRMRFDIGEHDIYRQYTEPFLARMDEYGIAYVYEVNPGWHANAYWAEHMADYLRWYAEGW